VKFTVLGGHGVIGRALVAGLRASAHSVDVLGRGDAWDPNADWGHAIYAVGMTADFRTRPFETVDAHVGLLSSALRHRRFDTFLYLSSTRIYLDADSTAETARLRVAPSDPSDLYNLSKLLGESLCLSIPRPGIRVARLSNVVGGQDEASENFIPSLLREARSGRIFLQTDLMSAKDYIHIDDVLRLLPMISTSGAQRIYNVASGVSIEHGQWIERLRALTGCRVEVALDAPRVCFPPIDVRRIRAEFGHHPRSALTVVGA
jgi:nucleoside-diphosphate-sugar epimerase